MVVWRRIGSHCRIKRTSSGSGPPPQDNAVSLNGCGCGCGCGCGRRGYKTFLRLLREFIEATVYWNDMFEDMVELDISAMVCVTDKYRDD